MSKAVPSPACRLRVTRRWGNVTDVVVAPGNSRRRRQAYRPTRMLVSVAGHQGVLVHVGSPLERPEKYALHALETWLVNEVQLPVEVDGVRASLVVLEEDGTLQVRASREVPKSGHRVPRFPRAACPPPRLRT